MLPTITRWYSSYEQAHEKDIFDSSLSPKEQFGNMLATRLRDDLGLSQKHEAGLFIEDALERLTMSDICYALLRVYGPLHGIFIPR